MRYAAIYDAFIRDRIGKQPKRPAYYERHHIVPRALGGGDEPANLIRLTPEDHFFAHLLLAKIHGGRMWAPVAFMVTTERYSRRQYGWVKRSMARNLSGKNAHQYDRTIRTLRHKDGREWSGTQAEISAALGISRSLANMLVKGRVKSALGWALPGVDGGRKGGDQHPMHRSETHCFRHVDGRSFDGTQFAFHQAMGVSKPAASLLARGKVKVWNGWHLEGVELPTVGRAKRWSRACPSAPSGT